MSDITKLKWSMIDDPPEGVGSQGTIGSQGTAGAQGFIRITYIIPKRVFITHQ